MTNTNKALAEIKVQHEADFQRLAQGEAFDAHRDDAAAMTRAFEREKWRQILDRETTLLAALRTTFSFADKSPSKKGRRT